MIVHGAFQSAAVWSGVKRRLEAAGHPVLLVELPGRSGNPCAAEQVSLDAHRDCALAAVSRFSEPVILVGHSLGGMTISAVAEAVPEQIHALVYVAAYLPESGQSARDLSAQDAQSRWNDKNFIIAADRQTARVSADDCVMLFGEDLEPQLQRALPGLLVDEPLAPIRTPVHLTPQRFGRVGKFYIKTLHDNTIGPELQDRMAARAGVTKMFALDGSHSPYLSRPDELAQLLLFCSAATPDQR